ncbi:MAG: hypothetical protein ABSG16_23650 [Candidatus Acidiferrum sp.]
MREVNSTTIRIAQETLERANQAISNSEPDGAEFLVWAERIAGPNSGMATPQTWRTLKEVAEKMLPEVKPETVEDDS